MKGLDIFTHSIRQVTGNLGGALKVSALPMIIQVAAMLAFAGGMMSGMGPEGQMSRGMGMGMGLGGLVVLVVAVVTSLWLAVAWHRFVLLNEQPGGYVPPYHGPEMMAYFLKSLAIGVILIVLGIVLGMVAGLLLSPLMMHGNLLIFMLLTGLFVQLPLTWLGLRMGTVLPGAATGANPTLTAGWDATKGAEVDILVLAAVAVVAHLALAVLGILVFDNIPIVNTVWSVAVTWLTTMVGVSILTTLYGHYIEKRALV